MFNYLRYIAIKDLFIPFFRKYLALKGPKRGGKDSKASLEANRILKGLISSHYLLGRYAQGAVPVAWVTSGAPVELLRCFGFYTIYPENHSALCAAQKLGGFLCGIAEDRGYSKDLCSYAKIDLGVYFSKKTPVGRLPKPDLLFASNNICQTVLYWYRVLSKEYSIPLIVFDTPYNFESLREEDLDFMVFQIKEIVAQLEKFTKKDFNMDELKKIMEISKSTCELWRDILHTMKAKPAPATIFDIFSHMLPVVSLRGLPSAKKYYKILYSELEHRRKNGISSVQTERIRLLWDNIAIWYKMRDLANIMLKHKANIVAATYTNAWAETIPYMDPNTPLESMAKAYSLVILNNNLSHRLELIRNLAVEYEVDGIIMHSARSCKPYSIGQYDIARILEEKYSIPCLILEADIADERYYADEQNRTRIEAFLEALS